MKKRNPMNLDHYENVGDETRVLDLLRLVHELKDKLARKPRLRFYVLINGDSGPATEEFKTAARRQKWLKKQDDTFDDFFCLNVIGVLDDYFTGWTGEDNT